MRGQKLESLDTIACAMDFVTHLRQINFRQFEEIVTVVDN